MLSALLVADLLVLDRRYSAGDIALHYLGIHGWFGDRLALSINDSFWFITLIVTLYLLFAVLRRFLGRPDQLLFWGFLASLALAVGEFRARRLIGFDHISLRIPGFFLGLVLGRLLKEGRLELPLSGALGAAAVLLFYAPYTQNFVFASVSGGRRPHGRLRLFSFARTSAPKSGASSGSSACARWKYSSSTSR